MMPVFGFLLRSMRFVTLLLLGLISIHQGRAQQNQAAQSAPREIPIAEFQRTLDALNPRGVSCDETRAPLKPWLTTPAQTPQERVILCRNHGAAMHDQLCQQATWSCTDATGIHDCWDPEEGRFHSVEIRRAAFRRARQIFEGFITNQGLIDRCCRTAPNPVRCAQLLGHVDLAVLEGGPYDSQQLVFSNANYRESGGSAGTVRMSVGFLMGCRTPQCVERGFLHELGHACYRARLTSADDVWIYQWGLCDEDNCQQVAGSTAQVMGALQTSFGGDTATCIARGVNSRPRGCFPTRLGEAFADGIFLSLWQSPSHFAWDCNAREDHMHALAAAYMGCFMDRPEVRNQLCPSQ